MAKPTRKPMRILKRRCGQCQAAVLVIIAARVDIRSTCGHFA
jgi:hypothetical protein